MEVLLILAVGIVNVGCFLIGVKTGQKVVKGEEVEIPSLNPVTAYKQSQKNKELSREQEIRDTIMWNVDHYDGTGLGQKDVNL